MIDRTRLKQVLAGAAFAASAFCAPSWAMRPDEMLSNPQLEHRARNIDKELRCLVCQNESIDDSDADLAHDLRVLVRQRIVAGDSDAQVKQYIVARYGKYVLLKPPFDPETYLLWFGPLLLLVGAGGAAALYLRRTAKQIAAEPLSPDEAQRLAQLLDETGHKED